jgi:hypothetical protein
MTAKKKTNASKGTRKKKDEPKVTAAEEQPQDQEEQPEESEEEPEEEDLEDEEEEDEDLEDENEEDEDEEDEDEEEIPPLERPDEEIEEQPDADVPQEVVEILQASPVFAFLVAIEQVIGALDADVLVRLEAALRTEMDLKSVEIVVNELQFLENLKDDIGPVRAAWLSGQLEGGDPKSSEYRDMYNSQIYYEDGLADFQKALEKRLQYWISRNAAILGIGGE